MTTAHSAEYVVDEDYLAWVADQQAQAERQAALWADEAKRHRETGLRRFRCECTEWYPCGHHLVGIKARHNDGSDDA